MNRPPVDTATTGDPSAAAAQHDKPNRPTSPNATEPCSSCCAHLEVVRRRRGIPKLTKRQWELLRLVRAGYSNTQIARRLYISPHTVRKHLENIFERLNVTSRTAALAHVFPESTPILHE
jgi:DNA-binding NarL/FixJ family response regulator